MTLTTRDHTMLRGAYEAIYQGTPVIVSNWTLLRDAFSHGAVHVDNTADAIAAAVCQLRQHHGSYKAGAVTLRQEKLAAWQQAKASLLDRIDLRVHH
jgi:glycosyltransferase involved in cell wall biosynthesis